MFLSEKVKEFRNRMSVAIMHVVMTSSVFSHLADALTCSVPFTLPHLFITRCLFTPKTIRNLEHFASEAEF